MCGGSVVQSTACIQNNEAQNKIPLFMKLFTPEKQKKKYKIKMNVCQK